MNKQNQLAEINDSGEPYIIYKSKKGFNLFTNFSKKIVLNNTNIKNFLRKKYKKKLKNTDLFIGFFGYEILNDLINIKIPKQKNINFPKGIFYKPEKMIKLSNILKYKSKKYFKIKGNKLYFDLVKYVYSLLLQNKIKKIDTIKLDTFDIKNKFFSARRALRLKHNDYGRNISIIMLN